MSRLLPGDIAATLPPLYATESQEDPIVYVKFFTPDSSWTWHATEYDPATGRFFGLVDGQEEELGYFLLSELEAACGPRGLPVERDLHWHPQPLSLCWRDARRKQGGES